jgi:predicted metal-dependent phosphoesterase TrpH
MNSSTTSLVLDSEALIDLQLHTTYSDGIWAPEQLLDYLVHEQFGLAAITDHDRVDIVPAIQQLALEKHLPLLVAVEMTAEWQGQMTDVLCFGFDPQKHELKELAQAVIHRQTENTREVYENLFKKGYKFSKDGAELAAILAKPSSQHLRELVELVKKNSFGKKGETGSASRIVLSAGGAFATNKISDVVEAAHASEAVCLIAHPGRSDGFVTYDIKALDELRKKAPIDGLEVYYPAHTIEQNTMFLEYTERYKLLVCAGSDSHGPDKPPIKYSAKLCRALLERLGIQVRQ